MCIRVRRASAAHRASHGPGQDCSACRSTRVYRAQHPVGAFRPVSVGCLHASTGAGTGYGRCVHGTVAKMTPCPCRAAGRAVAALSLSSPSSPSRWPPASSTSRPFPLPPCRTHLCVAHDEVGVY